MELLEWMRRGGGVCTVQAALDRVDRAELHRLRGKGLLWTPLRGWLALDGVRSEVTRALRLGGVVSCASALRMHGCWTPHGDTDLHVRVRRETHSERVDQAERTPGVRVHRLHGWLVERRPVHGVDSPLAALAAATGCLAANDVFAAAESALARNVVEQRDLDMLAGSLPRRRRRPFELASAASGSGSESWFLALLRAAGVRDVRQQVEAVPGVFVDFLIGRSLVVEIDSWRWHGTRTQQAHDRRRDAALVRAGYCVLRFTYEQVLFEPEWVREQVLALIRRRVHRRQLVPTP